MLQRELPEMVRKTITDALFKKYVSSDERAFSQELYMSIDQLQCLYRHGMYIGSHGYNHYWLDHLERKEQETEICQSLEFLRRICGTFDKEWIMCYPHGAYNDSLLAVLANHGCAVGLTIKLGIADLEQHHPLALPRINTNDLPQEAGAEPNQWTLEAQKQGRL